MKYHLKLIVYLCAFLVLMPAHAGSYEDFFRFVNVDNVSGVQQLLERGFDPNTPSEKGQVGLYLALRDDSPRVAAALLAHPQTQIDAANAAGETPLMMAALRGQLALAQQLLARGAQLDRPGWTPLHYAATGPEPKMVLLLLDRKAPIEALSPNHTTPLMMAARYGPDAAVKLLLARGASAQARNDAGLNAADFARLGGRAVLAEALDQAAR